MVKILFYGGCHALVLRDLFQSIFGPETVQTDLVINFKLIASAQPFPEALLEWSDAVVFSPIENKGVYNTDCLVERCRAAKTRPICFPWLEWHSYCPGAHKGIFKGRFQWFYPELLEVAERFDSFGVFVDHVVSRFPSDDLIDRTFERTSEILTAAEKRHKMSVKITDFIAEHYRSSRLFLISDHPALAVYVHVVGQIAHMLGIPLPSDLSTRLPSREPQWRWRTPILPRVAERLGLEFADTDWCDDELLPDRTWPLETYLSLYFHKDSVILGPLEATDIHLPGGLVHDPPVDFRTRIIASPIQKGENEDLDSFAYIETLAGRTIALAPDAPFKIDSKRWRSTWHF